MKSRYFAYALILIATFVASACKTKPAVVPIEPPAAEAPAQVAQPEPVAPAPLPAPPPGRRTGARLGHPRGEERPARRILGILAGRGFAKKRNTILPLVWQ